MNEKLYLGVARSIITPKIGACLYGYRPDLYSESVADDLTATALYFRQADRQALMMSITVCEMRNDIADRLLNAIQLELGIPRSCCQLHVTHTHSGPNTNGAAGWGDIDMEYCETIFIPKILEAARDAVKDPQPVKMGTARGDSLVGINRDELKADNKIILGQNPWGCFDPKMTVISFQREDGTIAANIIHYAAHGTCAGACTAISRDWSGVMTDALEKKNGGITAFFNGPEGDIGPRLPSGNTAGRSNMQYVLEMGHLAARDALEIYSKIYDYHDVTLTAGGGVIRIPLQSRPTETFARQELEKYKDQTVNWDGHLRNYYERVLADWENGVPEAPDYSIFQTVIGFGSLIFAAFPYELYSQIGMRLNNAFNAEVLSLSLTNGDESYFVPEDAICRGYYAVSLFQTRRTQPPYDNADWHLLRGSIENITAVTGIPERIRPYHWG